MQSELVTTAITFGAAALTGIVGTLAARRAATRWGLLDDVTSSRKIHKTPIPRLGGAGIAVGFFAALATAIAVHDSYADLVLSHIGKAAWIGLCSVALLGVGLFDDLRGVRARHKLLAQILAAAGLYAAGVRLDAVTFFPGHTLELGWFAPIATVFWVVAVINALNLIDGMDGLAAGVAVVATIGATTIALVRGDWLTCVTLAALAGATIGFLLFNFHPASIFMGDTGSMFLGAVLAVGSMRSARTEDGVAIAVPIILLGLPILDTTLAFVRRSLLGRSPFSADKDHLHHRLILRFGMSHVRTVLTLYGVAVSFALLAVATAFATPRQVAALWILSIGFTLMVAWRSGYLQVGKRILDVRRRNADLRDHVRGTRATLRNARTVDHVWTSLQPVSHLLNAAKLELHLDRVVVDQGYFQAVREAGEAAPVTLQVPLRLMGRPSGKLVVVWRDGRTEVDRDEELALEALAAHAQEALASVATKSRVRPLLVAEPKMVAAEEKRRVG